MTPHDTALARSPYTTDRGAQIAESTTGLMNLQLLANDVFYCYAGTLRKPKGNMRVGTCKYTMSDDF
jgi:hypothetical protein